MTEATAIEDQRSTPSLHYAPRTEPLEKKRKISEHESVSVEQRQRALGKENYTFSLHNRGRQSERLTTTRG